MRLFLRAFTYVAVAATAAVAAVVIMLVFLAVNSEAFPPPFQALPEVTSEVPAAVQDIVEDAFPAGTPEKEMIATLSSWGFDFSYGAGQLSAYYPGWSCIEMFSVSWTSDPAGRVSRITTKVEPDC